MKADTFVSVSSAQQLSGSLITNGVFTDVAEHYKMPSSERTIMAGEGVREEPQEGIALREHLQHFMEQQRPYLDSQLTLQKLAALSDIPAYRISDILNKHIGVNFFDFVNRYRIEEWKRQIVDASPSTTIQEVAFQSGFNSKSSFNAAFKKHTGQTPSQYRAQYIASVSRGMY